MRVGERFYKENPYRKERTIIKTTRKLKTLIATILTLAVALTNATLDNIIANASTIYQKDRTEMENAGDLADTTVTMQAGDTKKIDFVEDDGKFQIDLTDSNSWSSSDNSVVSIRREWYRSIDEISLELSYLTIKAEKPGAAVITGVNNYAGKTVSFTVNVKAPKVTAKQKKCKHKWKTTKKATCLESGMKTCRKCKMQRITQKKEHKLATEQRTFYEYTYNILVFCPACVCNDKETREYHNTEEGRRKCKNMCGATFSSDEYGSLEAAKAAWHEHRCKEHPEYKDLLLNQWFFQEIPNGKKPAYKDITYCTQCGYDEKRIDLIFNVNDPDKTVYADELRNE